jgi:hypothetical protein
LQTSAEALEGEASKPRQESEMRALACVLAVACLLSLGSCKATQDSLDTSGPINAYCAMQHDEAVDASCYVEHKGKKIAFCCKNCKKKFQGLTDAEKDERINTLPH